MGWTVANIKERFGEDVLRDTCGQINELMCGRGGPGDQLNLIGVPEAIWRKLLAHGGFSKEGIEKALHHEKLRQKDTRGPFAPYTIRTLANINVEHGGPLSSEELDQILCCALKWRQLI